MKKFITLIISIICATSVFAQYPLPATQVLGDLTVPNDSVGIGTNSPNFPLDVVGDVKMGNDSSQITIGDFTRTIGGFPVANNGFNMTRNHSNSFVSGISSARNSFTQVLTTNMFTIDTISSYNNYFATEENRFKMASGVSFTSQENSIEGDTSKINIIMDYANSSFVVFDADNNQPLVISHADSTVTTNQPYTLKYVDGNQSNGYVLTSDANGVATWRPPQSSVLHQTTGTTTTGTTWETLGSYTIPSNTLSDGSSLDLDFFTSGNVLNDSLLVLFGSDTALIARCSSGAYVETVQTFYETAGSVSFGAIRSAGSVRFGTEDNSSSIDVEIKAKSQTTGNQTLDFFRIKYFD